MKSPCESKTFELYCFRSRLTGFVGFDEERFSYLKASAWSLFDVCITVKWQLRFKTSVHDFPLKMPLMSHRFSASVLALFLAGGIPFYAHGAVDLDNPAVELTAEQYPAAVERLILEKNFEKALSYIEEGLEKNPLSAQLRFQKCVLFERSGQDDLAKEELEAFIKTYPEIPEAYNNLARIVTKAGDFDRAQELLERAVALRPGYATARENLGSLYLTRALSNLKIAARNGSRSAAKRATALESVLKEK